MTVAPDVLIIEFTKPAAIDLKKDGDGLVIADKRERAYHYTLKAVVQRDQESNFLSYAREGASNSWYSESIADPCSNQKVSSSVILAFYELISVVKDGSEGLGFRYFLPLVEEQEKFGLYFDTGAVNSFIKESAWDRIRQKQSFSDGHQTLQPEDLAEPLEFIGVGNAKVNVKRRTTLQIPFKEYANSVEPRKNVETQAYIASKIFFESLPDVDMVLGKDFWNNVKYEKNGDMTIADVVLLRAEEFDEGGKLVVMPVTQASYCYYDVSSAIFDMLDEFVQ